MAVLGVKNHPRILLLHSTICLDYRIFPTSSFLGHPASYVHEDLKKLILPQIVGLSTQHLHSEPKITTHLHINVDYLERKNRVKLIDGISPTHFQNQI